MISVVLATLNDERRLGGTLACLVPAAVDGLVRQLIVADGGSTDATLEIADDAGAVIVGGGLGAACEAARQPWLLVLDAAARLEPGWEPIAHAHMQQRPLRAGRIGVAGPKGFGGWLNTLGRRKPVAGLLAPKAILSGRSQTLAALAKEAGRGAVAWLEAKATIAP